MKILLLSAYDALSHRRWRQGLVEAFPQHEWIVLSLPPRYFNWRIRGNSLTWAFDRRDVLAAGYDRLITTSMTDLSALRGLVPELADIPTTVYFHENQFAYPASFSKQKKTALEPKVVTLYSALAADRIVFNSTWNRDSFLRGVQGFLKAMPDHVPDGLAEYLKERSFILPVPLNQASFVEERKKTDPGFTILWNHRWEYDKAPDRFFMALLELKKKKLDFMLNIIGQQFRRIPEVFQALFSEFSDRILNWGFVENEQEYWRLLESSHAVVSTALHDFQGLAVLEAVASGCIPVVPDRLAYPEFFPEMFRYRSDENNPEQESQSLADHLHQHGKAFLQGHLSTPPVLDHLSWERLRPAYRAVFDL